MINRAKYENEFELLENKLQVRVIVIKMVSHENSFSHCGKEDSEMVYFVKKLGKNEQLCQIMLWSQLCVIMLLPWQNWKSWTQIKYQNFGEG